MTDPIFCQIRVKGHLSEQWQNWFGGLVIKNQPDGYAVLSGPLPDQAALYGVLSRMRDLGLALVSLNCDELDPAEYEISVGGKDVRHQSQAKQD
jgi:hypothetical protein